MRLSGKIIAVLALFLVPGFTGFAQAQEKDWGIVIGAKTWLSEWDMPIELFTGKDYTSIFQYESDKELAYVPSLSVRYKNFFVGGSYLPLIDYKFKPQEFKFYSEKDGSLSKYWILREEYSGKREEWDINAGYFLFPNLAISLGYKKFYRKVSNFRRGMPDPNHEDYWTVEYPQNLAGPIIGFSTSFPIVDRMGCYGNFAYGFLNGDGKYNSYWQGNLSEKPKGARFDLEGRYQFLEFGLNYAIPISQSSLIANAGYRIQRLDFKAEHKYIDSSSMGKSGDQHDSAAGFVFGLSFAY